MTFDLTREQVKTFSPITGHALLKTIPPEYESESGMIAIPKGIAHSQQEAQSVRKGVLLNINRIGIVSNGARRAVHKCDLNTCQKCILDEESLSLEEGQTVYYYGHMDESDNPYVVVKIGQIVAVEV